MRMKLAIVGLFLLTALLASCSDEGNLPSARKTESVVLASTSPDSDVLTDDQARLMGFNYPVAPARREKPEMEALNGNCVSCHVSTDEHTMHKMAVSIACVDCHGGNPRATIKELAHVLPRSGKSPSAANPRGNPAELLKESADYVRFVNPGDLRAARAACYNCHADVVRRVEKSMMAHGAMLWGAALYNNGAINRKDPVFGESYAPDGTPRKILQHPRATTQQVAEQGILTELFPLIRWEISQPGNILRVFERGARLRPQVGVPEVLEDPGRPDVKLSLRGFGTDVRTDPVFIGLQKTRLLDPTLNLPGTNDHAGDYRAGGCSACHVIYANDRSPVHSGVWAEAGNRGYSWSDDPTIPKDKSGHPVKHVFVKNVPSSSCIVCHIHPGTTVTNSYLGYTWWDNETDGESMYPRQQKYPTEKQQHDVSQHNPEGAAPRGLWSNLYPNDVAHNGLKAGADFLGNLYTTTNAYLKRTQFADFHGHGWVFRAVYKQDRKGNLLDRDGKIVEDVTNAKLKQSVHFVSENPGDKPPAGVPVHLKDIHIEMGMHCVDCHFEQDSHGDGNLYGETRNATLIECVDCHGSISEPPKMLQYMLLDKKDTDAGKKLLAEVFTGNAAKSMKPDDVKKVIGNHFTFERAADGQPAKLMQTSAVDPSKSWEIKQTVNSSRGGLYAHTMRRDGKTWGTPPEASETDESMKLAHGSDTMSCYACHTSWNTSCFGCHLPMKANQAKPMLHNEGLLTRNYTNYNFQTLRDDVYMLGRDSSVKDGKIVPIRSACAVLVSSQDANRQWIYTQQQTVSAEGFSGQAFSPYFPHTVRTTETKRCTDCHISAKGDNNAVIAQLMLQGTNSVNFIGRFAWIAAGKGGLEAIAVTERDEPQAVIGSRLHELAYPDYYRNHVKRGLKLSEAHDHHGTVYDVQLRGEYVYAACGSDGFIAYDVANIDNKGFSERIVTAPVSPLGQRFYVKTRFATAVASPSTLALDPTRPRRPENLEGPIHLMYAFLYLTDKHEGLVVIGNSLDEKRNKPGVATLLDGDPENNFLKRAVTFNPGGALKGARSITIFGTYAYICCDSGLAVVDLNNPLEPKLISTPGLSSLRNPRKVAFQFRYGFVCDDDGMKVIDVTDPAVPHVVDGARVELPDARDIYLSRTYGYIAGGAEGLVIVDLENPVAPSLVQKFSLGDHNDANAVKVGMTNSSMFAYVADGHNGLKVVQLTSADERDGTPGYMGFSPKPNPRVIAKHHTHGPALAISEGLDRDRAVDESGHQLAVFGRKGARPFTRAEAQKMYLRADENGKPAVWTVSDEPTTEPLKPKVVEQPEQPKEDTGGRRRPRR